MLLPWIVLATLLVPVAAAPHTPDQGPAASPPRSRSRFKAMSKSCPCCCCTSTCSAQALSSACTSCRSLSSAACCSRACSRLPAATMAAAACQDLQAKKGAFIKLAVKGPEAGQSHDCADHAMCVLCGHASTLSCKLCLIGIWCGTVPPRGWPSGNKKHSPPCNRRY